MHNSQLLTVRLFYDSEWANFTGLHISKNESDRVWLAISDKLKWPHRNKNWYKTILNSTQIWFQLIGYIILDPAMKATQENEFRKNWTSWSTNECLCLWLGENIRIYLWHFPFSLAFDRVSSQEIWQIMYNSQLLTIQLFFDSEWANFTGLHISKNESDIVWLTISDKLKWLHRYKNWYKTILNSFEYVCEIHKSLFIVEFKSALCKFFFYFIFF
jgi:hypothetical protein